jgi:hypothetical protein
MYQRSTGFALETPALTQRPSPPRERQPVAPWSTPASASHLSESPIAQRCRTGALNHRPHRRDEVNLSAFLAQRTYARRDLHPHDPGHGFSEPSSESDPRAVRRGLATSGRCLAGDLAHIYEPTTTPTRRNPNMAGHSREHWHDEEPRQTN